MIDFTIMVSKHSMWRLRLRAFLDGREGMTLAEATSARDCDLGKWLQSVGLPQHGKNPDIHTLNREHQRLHDCVKRIIQAKEAGKPEVAEAEFKSLTAISEKVTSILKSLGKQTSSTKPG